MKFRVHKSAVAARREVKCFACLVAALKSDGCIYLTSYD